VSKIYGSQESQENLEVQKALCKAMGLALLPDMAGTQLHRRNRTFRMCTATAQTSMLQSKHIFTSSHTLFFYAR